MAGGTRIQADGLEKGYFVRPTVFADAKSSMRIVQEEIFGPVVAVLPFDSEDDAVRIGNDTMFGLGSGIWTRDVSRAHKVARRLKAGSVWVNCYAGMDESQESITSSNTLKPKP